MADITIQLENLALVKEIVKLKQRLEQVSNLPKCAFLAQYEKELLRAIEIKEREFFETFRHHLYYYIADYEAYEEASFYEDKGGVSIMIYESDGDETAKIDFDAVDHILDISLFPPVVFYQSNQLILPVL